MIEYVFLCLVGCLLGVFTGLTPGVHVNTVCLVGLSLYGGLGLNVVEFGVVMVAMSVTHTFLDFIPAIFLGVPDESTALSVLPTHRLVLEGSGFEAVKLTAVGSLLGLVYSILLLVPMLYILPILYSSLRGVIVYVISFAALALMLRERGRIRVLAAGLVFLVSGFLGILCLEGESLSSTYVMFPIFSGLFGLSGIISSLVEKAGVIPQKCYARVSVDKEVLVCGFLGSVGGMIVGVLPAMSPSQVGILMSALFGSSLRGFLISVSAINTSDAIYSLVSLYTLRNPRSGVAVMLSRVMELGTDEFILYVGVFCFSALIAYRLHMFFGGLFTRYYGLIDYRLISCAVIIFVVSLVFVICGWFGVLILFCSTSIGLLPVYAKVSRTHLMGVLLVPTILYFIGVG